jgi:tetratricopeptide (TPR) repeat protein
MLPCSANTFAVGGAVCTGEESLSERAQKALKMHCEKSSIDRLHVTRIVSSQCGGVMGSFLDSFETKIENGIGLTAEAYMFGPFRVVGRDGSELTPKGQVRRAILAVLLMSPGQSCTKQFLLDLFWAQSPPVKSRASLRTALSALKKELAPIGDDVIASDRYHVRLASKSLTAGLAQGAEAADLPFLQDLDVEVRGAEGFEDWLRDMRLHHDFAQSRPKDTMPSIARAARMLTADHAPIRDMALGLLPCRMSGTEPQVETRANLLVDQLLETLSTAMSVKLFDYRDGYGVHRPNPASLQHGNGPRFMLQPSVDLAARRFSLRLVDARSQEVLWSSALAGAFVFEDTPQEAEGETDIARCVEQVIAAVGQGVGGEEPLLSPYHALISMFQLEVEELDRLDTLLVRSQAQADDAYLDGLKCYLATIRVAENIRSSEGIAADELYGAARRAMRPDAFHGYNLAMAGYALSFLSGQKELGLDLTTSAVEVAPTQAFCWDQHALCLFSLDAYDAAFAAAQKAQALGAHSPIRYTYDTTAAIIAFARGDYLSTARYGNRAMFRMPRFTPALKYTAAALGQLNQLSDSRRLLKQMQRVGGYQTLGQIKYNDGLPQRDGFRDRLVLGLQRAGLK